MSDDFEALWEALAQYIDNASDDPSEREMRLLSAAERMLEKMDAQVCALAEETGK